MNIREIKDRPSCYELSQQVMGEHVPLDCVRLEVTPTCFHLLPYHHLEVGKFEAANDRDTIELSFVNHKVKIVGRNLRVVAIGIQERAVRCVRPLPERYAATYENAAYIESIEIE